MNSPSTPPQPATTASASTPIRPPRQRARLRWVLMVAVPLLALGAAAVVYLKGGRLIDTDNAYVKADKLAISANIPGMITEVKVQENQAVRAGDVLYRLDPASFQVSLHRAEARLAQVRTDLLTLQASYRLKQGDLQQAQTRRSFALKEQQRQADLQSRNFVAASRLDEARQNAELSSEQVHSVELDLARIAQSLGGRWDAPIEQHPAYRAALAEVEQARLDLSRTEVHAPVAGTVSKPPKVGQFLAPGNTALALVASDTLWVEANFTETELTHVHPGQSAEVRIDTFPGQVWADEVESLSPATGAEFSVIPAQNATGNWVKVTQRVPLRIRLSPREGQPPLRAGLSASVQVDTGYRRQWLGFSF